MELGSFSVSLVVKDLAASMAVYEKLGFTPVGGDAKQNWLILKNGDHIIGLFQGMFEGNILTFNPGWDQDINPLDSFTDVRELQQKLKDHGITLDDEVDDTTSGPGSIMLKDPDGNQILIDQHR
jgi:catechol 2,3-dioxygenase-like lactoylglutathione lyase family enzyme